MDLERALLAVEKMTSTRSINNVLWMSILRIALEHAPEETARVIRGIRHNDREIGNQWDEIGDS